MNDLYAEFVRKAGLKPDHSLRDLLEAIRSIPQGRPKERTARGVVESWRGTCSTKHLLLKELCPQLEIQFVHRVFRLLPDAAEERLGARVANLLPREGVVDVHTYATGMINGRRTVIDLTFPGEEWDGKSDMRIPWENGNDYDAGVDPIATKEELVKLYGDPAAREILIKAIS